MEKNTAIQKNLFADLLYVAKNIFDAILNRFLFITIAIVMFFSSISIWNTKELGLIVYLTTSKEIIGSRPSRLWGLLSITHLSILQAKIVIFVICLLCTLCISLVIYFFIRDIKDLRNRLISICIVSFVIVALLDYLSFMMWDYASLSLYFSFAFATWGMYFLFKTDKRFLAPLFTAAAQFTDCRALLFMLPAMLLVVFVKQVHKEDPKLKLWNMLALIAASLVLVLSFVTTNFENIADADMVDAVYAERFIENGTAEKDIHKENYGFKFEGYLRVTPQELFSDVLTNGGLLKGIPFEDNIQLVTLMFISSIALYDHVNIKKHLGKEEP